MVAAKLVLERVLPVRRGRPVRLTLPPVNTPAELSAAVAVLIGDVASGALTTEEATSVAALLALRGKVLELVEIEARLRALEKAGSA